MEKPIPPRFFYIRRANAAGKLKAIKADFCLAPVNFIQRIARIMRSQRRIDKKLAWLKRAVFLIELFDKLYVLFSQFVNYLIAALRIEFHGFYRVC